MYKFIMSLILVSFSAFAIEDADFDKSNGLDIMEEYSIVFDEPVESSKLKLNLLRENYQRLKPSKISANPSPLIPKVIHQIWLGDNALPKNYQYYRGTWKKFHPDWEVKLWSEADLINEGFASMDLYWLAQSFQERADIMRYEILKKYGGLYVDTDIECLANYDELNHKYDFYAGMETPVINKFVVSIPNSLIGAAPNHPILVDTLEKLRLNWKKTEDLFEHGDSFSRHVFIRSKHFLAVHRSMYPFSEAVYSFLKQSDQSKYRSVILPAGYNTPIFFVNKNPWQNLFRKFSFRKMKFASEIIIQPETMSFQHYGKERSVSGRQSSFDDKVYDLSFFELMRLSGEKEKDKYYRTYDVSFLEKARLPKLKEKDKYYLNFKDLFNKGFPLDDITYEPTPQIPEVIYLYNDNNLSIQELIQLKERWQHINRFFNIKIIDDDFLRIYLPKNFIILPKEIIKQIAPFYLLKSQGGIYISSQIKPVDLHEFNYKFSYYGKFLKAVDIESTLKLDRNLIAVRQNHIIINSLLKNIESHISKYSSITEAELSNFYLQNVYRFNQLDGRNIVFPESIFQQKRDRWIVQ